MKPSRLNPFVAICFSLLVSVQVHAQPLFGGAESIECTVANSEIVVVGKLVAFAGKEQVDKLRGRAATIVVEETLKGEHRDRLRVRLVQPATVLAEWKDHSSRLLLAARGNPLTETEAIDLADKDLQVLTADFALLRKPEAVIRAAKETVRRMPGVKQIDTFRLVVPNAAIVGTRWEGYSQTGGYTTLIVPVDERLEKRAQEYVRSKSYMRREEAAQALRYFKSDENVARVKALLNDPDWSYLHHPAENSGLEVRLYGVREKAYATLKYWGVRVEKPMIREEILNLESVQLVDLSNRKATDAELKDLARFKNLQDVILRNTEVTDEQLKDLADLTNLQNLYLGGTKVTDAGLKHLARLPNLHYLGLGGTTVTDAGLKVLADFCRLRKLDLGDTKVTARGVAELHKRRPDLKIER